MPRKSSLEDAMDRIHESVGQTLSNFPRMMGQIVAERQRANEVSRLEYENKLLERELAARLRREELLRKLGLD